MRPSKGKSEPKGLPPVPKAIERFGKASGSKVLLLVGHDGLPGGCHRFLVSEPCLYNLGLRWQELLSNQSITKPSSLFGKSPKTVSLRDEHANTVRLIMHIAHLQFTKLPRTLDFPELVHLADVAARYEAHSLLVNNIHSWLEPYLGRLLDPGYEEWLFIAYQFGYEAEYLELAKHLALHCRVDPSRTWLLAPGTEHILEGKFPVDTLEHILEGRSQILSNMLKATYELWGSVSRGYNCKVTREDEPDTHKCCAALNLFEMTNYLRGLELFPMLKETSTLQSAPHELSTMLFNAQQMIPSATTLSIGRRGTVPVQSPRHGQCHIGFRLANTMTRVLVNVPWPVEIPTLLSIKRNGEKLGKQSQRRDEASDFLSRESLLERKLKVVRTIEAALETDPNVLSMR